MSQYVFKAYPTPMGRTIMHLYQGFDLVGVSKKSYDSAEEAMVDLKKAIDQNRLDQVVRYADGKSHDQAH